MPAQETQILVNNQPIKESVIAEHLDDKQEKEKLEEEEDVVVIAPIPEENTPENKVPIYKVQIATSTKKLELLPQNFNGLNDIDVYEEYKLFKYTLGTFKTLEEAKKALSEAKQKGYSDAFLIAFYQNKKISIKEAQRLNP